MIRDHDEATPHLRADAQRNRDRLLASAEQVFSETGADASLDEVARHAKVGIGTLYRHFPTRDALLAALCDDRLLSLAQHSRASDEEPGAAIRAYLEQLARHTIKFRGLAASLGVVLKSGTPGCRASNEEGQRLLTVAQKSGAIRKDVTFSDLVCVATAISMSAAESGARRIPKLVSMFLEGLQT